MLTASSGSATRAIQTLLASLALGALLVAKPSVAQPRTGADCLSTSPPTLTGASARIDASGRAILTWAKTQATVNINRTGSDGSKAAFAVAGASAYTDTTISPVVATYTYGLQAVDCAGQSPVVSVSVQNPALHLVVSYTGGSYSVGGAPICKDDCSLAALNFVLSCGYPGFAPYLPGCDFSGTMFSRGRQILPVNPLPIGGTACSSTAVMPPSSASVAAIGGSVVRNGSSTIWKANIADRPLVQQMATPSGRSWGTTDLGGNVRLAAQCPPGTLTP